MRIFEMRSNRFKVVTDLVRFTRCTVNLFQWLRAKDLTLPFRGGLDVFGATSQGMAQTTAANS